MAFKGKHVIFLGAGASYTSGYPIGEELRLRLCSRAVLLADLKERATRDAPQGLAEAFYKRCQQYFDEFQDSIDLFRYGGFGTVDEFSKLASAKYPERAQDMKRIMRIAFTLHNPEEHFEKSDYYPFVQRLFKEDLHTLRDDLTILSYNYDCYLDFLLLRAYLQRQDLAPTPHDTDDLKNTITSGFFNVKDVNWAAPNIVRFRHLKLHGSICYPTGEDFSHAQLFTSDLDKRFPAPPSAYTYKNSPIPPIVFPWEIFSDEGGLISQQDFIFTRHGNTPKQKEEAVRLWGLYKEIWCAAQEDVSDATKISFVGLSMHPYMEQGLKFLFKRRKEGKVQMVIANVTNDMDALCRTVSNVLRKVAPSMLAKGEWTDERVGMDVVPPDDMGYSLTRRKSFREFIERDLGLPA
jgi:hypothetical protein